MKIATIGKIHKQGLKLIPKNKFEIIQIDNFSPDNLKKNLSDVDAIAIRTANLTNGILKYCKKLKIVSRHGVGFDNIDINYLNQNNIPLAITGTSNAISVAEHVVMMMLNLSRKSNEYHKLVRLNKFEKNSIFTTYELYNKNILILGFGRIGKELQKRCKSFGMNVFVHDPYVKKYYIIKHGCRNISFKLGIKKADYISIHVPLNKSTRSLITKRELKQMKKNCFIINTARGDILNQKDLFWAINNKIIGGAGLDVFQNEPPLKNDPLLKSNNVILSPHNSALTQECQIKMGIETINNILNFFSGNLVESNVVNKEVLNIKNA